MAASQCPKCSHPLGLRDDYGNEVRLAYCAKCNCYYPRRRGECKWCGTKPRAFPTRVLGLSAAAVVTLAVAGWGIVRALGGDDSEPIASGTMIAQLAPAERARDGTVPDVPIQQPAPQATAPATNPVPPPSPATADTGMTETSAPTTPPAVIAQPTSIQVAAAPPVGEAQEAAPRDTVVPFPGGEGTARTWVNVRASTDRDAEVLGIITPDTRVTFGESRRGWVMVTSADLSGWADRRLFVVVRQSP